MKKLIAGIILFGILSCTNKNQPIAVTKKPMVEQEMSYKNDTLKLKLVNGMDNPTRVNFSLSNEDFELIKKSEYFNQYIKTSTNKTEINTIINIINLEIDYMVNNGKRKLHNPKNFDFIAGINGKIFFDSNDNKLTVVVPYIYNKGFGVIKDKMYLLFSLDDKNKEPEIIM